MSETVWTTCEATLSCGHVLWLFDTTAPIVEVGDRQIGWYFRKRKDGWWSAYRCKHGCGRRAVRSVRIFDRNAIRETTRSSLALAVSKLTEGVAASA